MSPLATLLIVVLTLFGMLPMYLPSRLRRPSIPLTLEWPNQYRRFQALEAWLAYNRELESWIRGNGLTMTVRELQEALGTTLPAFYAVADPLDPDRRARLNEFRLLMAVDAAGIQPGLPGMSVL